jgi:Schlafen, AlbA_2
MRDIRQDAITAIRESKQIEFKLRFDPSTAGEWCEIVKDIVAIANTGGGIIVFGLDSQGTPVGTVVDPICAIDPADISNKLSKYIGTTEINVSVCELEKAGVKLAAFLIESAETPVVFQKPGTYDIGGGKQKTAFSVGTVYFRHGAKSEPGTSDDIRKVLDSRVSSLRKTWMQGLKKVVQAPRGAQVIIAAPTNGAVNPAGPASRLDVRAVKDPRAPALTLTRDKSIATGTFIHEQISDSIFEEINNVMDANRVLAEGQQKFLLGLSVYYRVYADRKHVQEDNFPLLLRTAIFDFYAPCLYWVCRLPENIVANLVAETYLFPRHNSTQFLINVAILFGEEFASWLGQAWDRRWKGHSQPPQSYWSFQTKRSDSEKLGPQQALTKTRAETQIEIIGEPPIRVAELMANNKVTEELLSKVCMKEFRLQGKNEGMRALARNLDVLAYGREIGCEGGRILKLVREIVGNREPHEANDSSES